MIRACNVAQKLAQLKFKVSLLYSNLSIVFLRDDRFQIYHFASQLLIIAVGIQAVQIQRNRDERPQH